MTISEQLPYSLGLVPGEEGGGADVRMGRVSLRSRDLAYLHFPGAIRALVLQTTHRKFAVKFRRYVSSTADHVHYNPESGHRRPLS